jgi:Bacterial Ig domain/Thrombospondin type 3 repeat
MNIYSQKIFHKFVLVFILILGLLACGGGGDSAPQQNPPADDPVSQNITGGGVEGPLANAVVTVFGFDASSPGFKGPVVATATTDASTAITGLNLPLPLSPPYIMEFTSVSGTTDITTGKFPVIATMRTVITQSQLDTGKALYASPLTTIIVDVAVKNAVDNNGTAGIQADEFEAALALASSKVMSTLGFGIDASIDASNTPPLINNETVSVAEQTKVAGYRSAVEAVTAIVYQISQQVAGASAGEVLADLASDLADDDVINGSSGSTLNASTLQVLQQDPSSLNIPNTSPVQTIADVQSILATETSITGFTTSTAALTDGTIVTRLKPAIASADADGDGVLNVDDDLPFNKDESIDSDGDGIGDNADTDDDNDGVLDVDEGIASTPADNDTDGDGIKNNVDNCKNIFNPAQTNTDGDTEGDACDLDDDGDGVDDVIDAFPVDQSRSVDTDSDGIDDANDTDDDNDGISDVDDNGLGLDRSTSCSLLVDCDGDGVLDGVDADRTDPNIGLYFAISINPIANVSINENSAYTSVTPAITGTPIGAVSYGLGGTDAADFSINPATGVVSMIARDFEAPVDANTDNIYELNITVTDTDANSDSEAWSVTITDVTETSTFTIDAIANVSINENSAYTSVTPAITGTTIGIVSYALSGADASLFSIDDVTGVASMVARDFENPADADGNNVYALTITATDSDNNTASQTWAVSVLDTVEVSPISITTISNVSINENSAYTSVTPVITGTPIGAVSYSLGGTDAADFSIDPATGVVSMIARDFEAPVDANTDNSYELNITVTDADGNSDSEAWSVTVVNVAEVSTISITPISDASVNENSAYISVTPAITGTPIGAVSYGLGGLDAADFSIDPATGVVSMIARDYEAPVDANTDNIYQLNITVTDADGNSDSEAWSVTITDVTEVSTFTINTINNVSINENSAYTSVTPAITGTPIGAVSYSLGGVDAASFTIDINTGVVNMVVQDFENPADADSNNVYALTITATDSNSNTASQSWTVSIQDVVEVSPISITAISDASVNENSAYTSVKPAITGAPIGAVSYGLDGTDAADFSIDPATGVVSMIARDFEAPVDANTDNIYQLNITVTDADGNSDSEAWSVTITDVTEVSTFTINTINNVSINENSAYTSVIPAITGTPIGAVNYSLGGTDAALFTVDSNTGVVSMVARDFEAPADAGANNVYELTLIATDADSNNTNQSWTVSVQDIAEFLAVDDSASIDEGQGVNVDLAANDIAENSLNLSSIVITASPSHASLFAVNSDGTVDYTHDGSETISDSFAYTIRDTIGTVSNQAIVTLTINPVNDLPVANDDNVTTAVDTTVVIPSVLANDTDDDIGDVLFILLPVTGPANGSLIYNGGGIFTYTPDAGFLGADSFTYTVTDSVASDVGTVNISVVPPGASIDIVTLMSVAEGGVASIENAEPNVYAYWADSYSTANNTFSFEDKVYNHLSGLFDTVVNTGDLYLNGTQWVSEGNVYGVSDGLGGLDLTLRDAGNDAATVASFKLTARFLDLQNVAIRDHLNAVWRGAMINPNETFKAGAKLITDYRFEAISDSYVLWLDDSCMDDVAKFADLYGNCNSIDVDSAVNTTGYAQQLSEVIAGSAWVDSNNDFSTPPGAISIAWDSATNKTLMVQLVNGFAANYYEVDWDSVNTTAFVTDAVAGTNWVQDNSSGVDMIHLQVPASYIAQYADDLSSGLNYFLTVQNGFVRQGLKHTTGDVEFSGGHFNGNAFDDILANFSAPVIPGIEELKGTWVSSVASSSGDPALIHIFASSNYESSGSCDQDGSEGMEYGTITTDGATANIIATSTVATQGTCGPSQGNKTFSVAGDVLTVSDPAFGDVIYNRLLGTTNPIVGSWLLGDIQSPGEAHMMLTMLDDTTFTLSQDCTTDLAAGFEYGTYNWGQGGTNDLTGSLSIDSNGGCGLHDNTAMNISGFTVTVVGDSLTLTDTVNGGSFVLSRISPAYVIPITQVVYTLDNLMMEGADGQMTGTFIWSYPQGDDFANGTAQFTEINIPGFGTDLNALSINFDMVSGIEITLLNNTNNQGIDIKLNFVTPLSPTLSTPIDTSGTATTSTYNIEAAGFLSGSFVSGTILPQAP